MLDEDDEDDDDDDDDDKEEKGEAGAPAGPGRPAGEALLRMADRGGRGDGASADNPDFGLDRPRAERSGEAGAPTKEEEAEDRRREQEEEAYPNPYLLMHWLHAEDAPVKLYGWFQGSFTANPGSPRGGENFGVYPNSLANRWQFQQIYFVLERRLREDDEFDYGFRIDNFLGYGWQSFRGIGFLRGVDLLDGFGWDMVQFYGEAHLPILTEGGIDLKLGRFWALPGYEDGIAPARALLSTSYMFTYAHPITQLGLMSTSHVTDRVNLYNGVNLYNTTVNNGDRLSKLHNVWGYAGGVSWDAPDDRANLTVTMDLGSNLFPPYSSAFAPPGVRPRPIVRRPAAPPRVDQPDQFAALFTEVLIHEWTDRLSTAFEADQALETNVIGVSSPGRAMNASWFGLGAWVTYEFTDRWTGVCRAEGFQDVGGTRTGYSTTFYETTLGAIYKPRPWLWFRPEIRGDWSAHDHPFHNGRSAGQLTFGFDVIFLF